MACPAGKYSDIGAEACIMCPSGTYLDGPDGRCRSCPKNTWSQPGSANCTLFPAGTWPVDRVLRLHDLDYTGLLDPSDPQRYASVVGGQTLK